MRTNAAVSAAAAVVSFLALATAAAAAGEEGAGKSAPKADAKASFEIVAKVLLSPRCRNCHPAGDRPLQFDEGRPHAQEVGRRASKLGLECSACHQQAPLAAPVAGPGVPPGAPNWGLPPEKTPMVFEGRTAAQLCRQLKDPAQTGGKDLAALLHHIEKDELVGWGWHPGEGRTPVSIPREELVAAFRAWMDGGAVCPD